MQSIKNKVKDQYEVIDELQVIVKNQAEAIEQLQVSIEVLEKMYVKLINNKPIKRQLEQGVEYISRIEEGSSKIDVFEWEGMMWCKYLIKLNEIDEPFEMIFPKHKRQPKIGEYISHYVIGNKIKTWRYVQNGNADNSF